MSETTDIKPQWKIQLIWRNSKMVCKASYLGMRSKAAYISDASSTMRLGKVIYAKVMICIDTHPHVARQSTWVVCGIFNSACRGVLCRKGSGIRVWLYVQPHRQALSIGEISETFFHGT
jgi:hypothetical protein